MSGEWAGWGWGGGDADADGWTPMGGGDASPAAAVTGKLSAEPPNAVPRHLSLGHVFLKPSMSDETASGSTTRRTGEPELAVGEGCEDGGWGGEAADSLVC